MAQTHEVLRTFHYSYATVQTYVHWIARYVKGNLPHHPNDLNAKDIERYLSGIASPVSKNTQCQALNAIVFLYHKVLYIAIDNRITSVQRLVIPLFAR